MAHSIWDQQGLFKIRRRVILVASRTLARGLSISKNPPKPLPVARRAYALVLTFSGPSGCGELFAIPGLWVYDSGGLQKQVVRSGALATSLFDV